MSSLTQVGWYWNRLRCMSVAEIVERAGSSASRAVVRRRPARLAAVPAARLEKAGAVWLPKLEPAFHGLALKRADEVLSGQWRVFSRLPMDERIYARMRSTATEVPPWKAADALGPTPSPDEGREQIDFMSPWPASVFKMMVATYVMKLLDRGQTTDGMPLSLETPIPLPSQELVAACPKEPQTLTLRQALETMLQWSGNCATASLVRFLHTHQEIVQSPDVDDKGFPTAPPSRSLLNELLASLGLSTMQMNRTIARTGRWGNANDNYDARTASVAHNHMTSWDTARLFWLFDDLPSALQPAWEVAPGRRVMTNFVSDAQKAVLREILQNAYSGSGLAANRTCPGSSPHPEVPGPPPELGIPARLASKWVDGKRLHSPVGDHPYARVVDELHPQTDSFPYSTDLSRCQAFADVEFLNKAGLTNVAGSSVGIVRGLSDVRHRASRHYIVSFFSTLGTRYTDEARLPALALPKDPAVAPRISTTQTLPKLGATLDAWLALWLE